VARVENVPQLLKWRFAAAALFWQIEIKPLQRGVHQKVTARSSIGCWRSVGFEHAERHFLALPPSE
jgi:hypothetical protein